MYSPLHGLSAHSSTFVQSERGRSAVLMYLRSHQAGEEVKGNEARPFRATPHHAMAHEVPAAAVWGEGRMGE